jgi:Prenyltransferase and squalene oxidase repeat
MGATAEVSFVDDVCLPFLRNAQNADGGWGFHPGAQSRVEATGWALQALVGASWPDIPADIGRGFQFLRTAQLPDGSWPATPGQEIGSWVTSLACWTLLYGKTASDAVLAGLQWLYRDWPGDSTPWRRWLMKLSSQRHISPMNTALRGWGWTPGTSSWVEPTSLALIALGQSPKELLPGGVFRRRQLAEAMLYDRMCPGGGWNCGNPRVYGVAGEPQVVPTVWALLALRGHPQRAENVASLGWLEKTISNTHGAGSLALGRICLETFGRPWPIGAPQLHDFHRNNEFLQNIQVAAWTCLALSKRPHWRTATPGGVL